MKNYSFFYILFCSIILSCHKDNYTSDSIAVTGFINNKKGVEVTVGKALRPVGEYQLDKLAATYFINTATVSLYEENTKIKDLKFLSKGKYVLNDSTWQPIVKKRYKIVVNIPNSSTVESELVEYPSPTTFKKFEYKIEDNDTGININTGLGSEDYKKLSYQFEIEDNNSNVTTYYETAHRLFDKDGRNIYSPFFLDEQNTKITIPEAERCGRLFSQNSTFFTNECLDNKVFYNLLLLFGSVPNTVNFTEIKRAEISLNTVSESYHKLKQVLAQQDLTDERFQEIPPSYTNIKNGIGVFYAVNEGEKTFTIKP